MRSGVLLLGCLQDSKSRVFTKVNEGEEVSQVQTPMRLHQIPYLPRSSGPGKEVPVTLQSLELQAQELYLCQDTCAPWDQDVHFSSGWGSASY